MNLGRLRGSRNKWPICNFIGPTDRTNFFCEFQPIKKTLLVSQLYSCAFYGCSIRRLMWSELVLYGRSSREDQTIGNMKQMASDALLIIIFF